MRLRSLAIATAFAVLPLSGALAEPQVLALLETNGAKALKCIGGECAAEFTSFCMEKPRASPTHNTAYSLIQKADDVRIVAETATGEKVSLPKDALRFASKRGFAAVRVSVDQSALARVGAVRVSVEVGQRVALQPIPNGTYREPHEPTEIAAAVGLNRSMGQRMVDRAGTPRLTADLVSKLINTLPESGIAAPDRQQNLWHDAITPVDTGAAGSTATQRARRGFQKCLQTIADYPSDSLGACLGRLHDSQIWPLTQKYWRRAIGS
jgi:hypothetical protein